MDTQKEVNHFNILIQFFVNTCTVLQSAHPACSMDGKPWSSCSSSAPGSWSRNRGCLPGHGHTWPSRALVRRQRLPRKYMKKTAGQARCDRFNWFDDIHWRCLCLNVLLPFGHVLTLSLSPDNSVVSCAHAIPCCQTTSNFPCKKQRAHGDFVKANNHQRLLQCRMRGFEGLGHQWYYLTSA